MSDRTSEKALKQVLPGVWRILVKFSPYISKQRYLLAGSFFALLADTALRLLQPWPLKFIFDRVLIANARIEAVSVGPAGWEIALPPTVLLALLATSVVAIAAASALMGYLSKFGMALAAVRVLAEVRGQLFGRLQRLSLAFHQQHKSGDLITRITADIERLRNATINAFVPFLTNAVSLIGMVGVMLWLNAELALIALLLLPVFVLLIRSSIARIRKAARRQRNSEGVLASTASETLGAIEVVQALALHDTLERVFAVENQQNLSQSTASLQLSALLNRMIQVLMALLIALILWRGSQLVLGGRLTPGDLLVFAAYIRETFEPPMRKFANQLGQMAKATASGERIADILDCEPQVRDRDRAATPVGPLQGAVRFEGVSFGYGEVGTTLQEVSFAVEPGQTVAIVGPSGSGKSTLISLLLRLYDPECGRIYLDGRDMRAYRVEALRRQISVVLQESLLFATSVRENIAYGKLGATDLEVERAARLAEAHEFIQQLPQGYDTVLGERGATLSGGQRQRIAIARAAIRQAPIVILDEPTAGLDRASERAVNAAFERLMRDKTAFVVSHDLLVIRNADLILYLEGGRILERGTHTELLACGGHYAALYSLQTATGGFAREL